VIAGEEDGFVPLAEAELMRHHIAGGVLKVIPRAGHYSPWEQPDAVGLLLRQFVESLG
jgi:pimeloyl-ACP methyl ester carboxylesterase